MEMKIIPQAANAAIIEIPGENKGDPPAYAQIHVYNGKMCITVVDTPNSNRSTIRAMVTIGVDGTITKEY